MKNIFKILGLSLLVLPIVVNAQTNAENNNDAAQIQYEQASGLRPASGSVDVTQKSAVGVDGTKSATGVDSTKSSTGANSTKSSMGLNPPETVSKIFTLQNPLKVDSIGGLVQTFIEVFSYIVILFAVLALIYTGFQYIYQSSMGNPSEIAKLHSRLLWLVVGVAIVIGARVIIGMVINTLSATGTVDPKVINSARNANGLNGN